MTSKLFNLNFEKAVIATLIFFPENYHKHNIGLKATDFFSKPYSILYNIIENLLLSEKPVDLNIIFDELTKNNLNNKVDSMNDLTMIAMECTDSSKYKYYATEIKNYSIKRELEKKYTLASTAVANNNTAMVNSLHQEGQDLLFKLEEEEELTYEQMIFKELGDIEIRHNQKIEITGIPTGYSELNDATGGWQKGNLIILAARPSMGKTSLMLNLAQSVSISGYKVACFSLEMTYSQIIQREIAIRTGIHLEKLKKATLMGNNEFAHLYKIAAKEMAKYNYTLKCKGGITPNYIKALLKQEENKGEPYDLILIDYLQLMDDDKDTQDRVAKFSNISKQLKSITIDRDIPIIALSQLSRNVEQRNIKIPMLSDLRETGTIEQDADTVIFLYDESYYKKDEAGKPVERTGDTDVIVAKNRGGKITNLSLLFDLDNQQFKSKSKH